MGKFRSKLKRKTKGKHWSRGQSATSNPTINKHRVKARSRFFQPNLSLAPPAATNTAPLTLEAISKHDARLFYAGDGKQSDPTVNDIATSLKSFSFDDGTATESQFGTFKTYQTFASNYSACSNVSFNKFLTRFKQSSELHKEMLAILAAITEVIKERNGTQSSTEYFLALLETIEVAKEENEIIAALSLLGIGIKSVPQPVLRKKFSECGTLLDDLFEKFVAKDNINQSVLRAIISCISTLLRAQEYSAWTSPLVRQLFNKVLPFVIDAKPKTRKEAQHAITAIIHGSCFMAPNKSADAPDLKTDESSANKVNYHPAGTSVANFCVERFKPENLKQSDTVILHTLALLKDTLNGLNGDDIKRICEHLLSIMAAAKVMVQTNCFHVLHSLFSSKSPNLNANLVGKLISAIYDYRPERSDVRQTLAWLTVLKQGHVCLTTFDPQMCVHSLPRFIEVTATDVWMSDNNDIVSGASHAIKEVLLECVKPVCETTQTATLLKKPINKILTYISRALNTPFGLVAKQVIQVYATVFEVTGQHFIEALHEPLKAIAHRYDEQDASRIQIEHTILAAIAAQGPEAVLKAFPLADGRNVIISRSWILPLLREAITQSTFEYFRSNIWVLADTCNENRKKCKAAGDLPMSHTYELLYCQLWGLFPGFCRSPRDMNQFGTKRGKGEDSFAKKLGFTLVHDPEVRAPILDGLKELLKNADDESKHQLMRFAKNFLSCLVNIYVTKPVGSYESEIRTSAMDVLREYLKIAPQDVLTDLLTHAKSNFKLKEAMVTIFNKLQDLNATVKRGKDVDDLIDEAREEQKKESFEIIESLLLGENVSGVEYIDGNIDEVVEHLKQIPKEEFEKLCKRIQKDKCPAFSYESHFDIIVELATFQSVDQLNELYLNYISPTIRNVKVGGVARTIKERQLKSYILLKNILSSENNDCEQFVEQNLKKIQKLLLMAVQTKKQSSQVIRLTCLQILLEKKLDTITVQDSLIKRSIPEAVVALHQAITKKKENIALNLLLKIGELFEKEEKLNDFVDILMAGFGGDSVLITNTIQTLRVLVQRFTGTLKTSTLSYILERVLVFLVGRSRPEAEAAINFLMIFIKILPSPYVANHLTEIVKGLSAMVPDTKRYCRLTIGFIWKRLCKRYTPEEIVKLVPGNDEVTHKKLKNIRKELSRLKRQKAANEKNASDDDDDDESNLQKKSYTIDDILGDSDSDFENDIMMDGEEKREVGKKKKKTKEDQKYIQEDVDSIVDFADINAFSRITSTKPTAGEGSNSASKKSKDKNRGFKISEDGRLIIEEPKRGARHDADSSDEDGEDDDTPGDKTPRTVQDSDSSDDDTPKLAQPRKRKAADSLSMASGKTGTSSRYVAGGKGIHRQMGGAASVRSGVSSASTRAASTAYGSEYRTSKAKGDVKSKGQKLDPYAYIPLNRTSLNKRKQAKNKGQFKNIVTGAQKGAASGSRQHKKRKL